MIRKHYDKILLAIALVCLLLAAAFAFLRPYVRPVTDYVDFPALRAQNTFALSEKEPVEIPTPYWPEPPSQPAGLDWLFNLFTPPEIFYNPATEQYTVISEPGPPPPAFGLQLADVRSGEYRVQLLGWVTGRTGGFIIQLQNLETNQVTNVREGSPYPALELEVRSFRVDREPMIHGGETAINVDVGRVVIFDTRTESEVTLISNERKLDQTPTAYFRSSQDPDRTFQGQEGHRFEYNGNAYSIVSITPPTVTVERVSLTDPEDTDTRTLAPQPLIRRPQATEEEDIPNGVVDPRQAPARPLPQTQFRPDPGPRGPPPPVRQPPRQPDGMEFAF